MPVTTPHIDGIIRLVVQNPFCLLFNRTRTRRTRSTSSRWPHGDQSSGVFLADANHSVGKPALVASGTHAAASRSFFATIHFRAPRGFRRSVDEASASLRPARLTTRCPCDPTATRTILEAVVTASIDRQHPTKRKWANGSPHLLSGLRQALRWNAMRPQVDSCLATARRVSYTQTRASASGSINPRKNDRLHKDVTGRLRVALESGSWENGIKLNGSPRRDRTTVHMWGDLA